MPHRSALRLRCYVEEAAEPGAEVVYETATRFGTLKQTVTVWTEAEWRDLPDEDRPRSAVRADNGVWVLLGPA